MRNFLYFVGSVVLVFSSILSVIFIHSRLVQANSETFYTNSFIIGLATFVTGLLIVSNRLKRKSIKYRIPLYLFPLRDTHERKNAIKKADIIGDMIALVVLTVGLLLIIASALLSTTL